MAQQASSKRQDRQPPHLALTVDEVAESLGCSVSHVYNMLKANRFPHPDVAIGNFRRWRPVTIDRWLALGGPDRATFEADRERLQGGSSGLPGNAITK
jgi:excisionase family DNA binding protein